MKTISDKACTHVKEQVDEVREAGKYLFWRNPVRNREYVSQYCKTCRGSFAPEEEGNAE